MSGLDPTMFENFGGAPTLTVAPGGRDKPTAGVTVEPHHGLIGLVVLAVVILLLLDRAGFRFAVTVGKR